MTVPFVRSLALAVALAAVGGCALDMHLIDDSMRDQVIRVRSGDRYYMTLPEAARGGARWSAKSDDQDVRVTIDHTDDGEAKVRLWIRRGFDGPANVTFSRRQGQGFPPKEFTISFYRATIDRAFWE